MCSPLVSLIFSAYFFFILGLFLRRMILIFDKLNFTQVIDVYRKLLKQCQASKDCIDHFLRMEWTEFGKNFHIETKL